MYYIKNRAFVSYKEGNFLNNKRNDFSIFRLLQDKLRLEKDKILMCFAVENKEK